MSNCETDVMVDLETLGVGPDAAIVQIGACTRDESSVFLASVDQSYYDKMHADRDFRYTYTDSTLEWWDQQSQEAKDSLELFKFHAMAPALTAFTDWFNRVTRQEEYPKVWANSPSFDLVILRHAYSVETASGLKDTEVPWKFWQERCFRTMKAEFGSFLDRKFPEDLVPHRADHDAIHQVRMLNRITDRITVNV